MTDLEKLAIQLEAQELQFHFMCRLLLQPATLLVFRDVVLLFQPATALVF
jgi:hypothetical protein